MGKTNTDFFKDKPLDTIFLDIRIFFVCLIYMQVLRWFFIFSLGGVTSKPSDIIYCLSASLNGMCYDVKLAFVLFFSLMAFSTLPSVFTIFSKLAVLSRWAIMTGFVFFFNPFYRIFFRIFQRV